MEFSRPEYWSGEPLPSPGDLPKPGIEPRSPSWRQIVYQLSYPEHQRIDVFELWCWRRHLRVPWTARRSNPSILKEISPEYSLEGLMLKLKLQYFGHLMWRTDSFEKTLMLGKIEGRRRRGHRGWDGWMASLAQWTWVWVSSRSWDREAWRAAVHGVTKSHTQLSDWTEEWGRRICRKL